MNAKVEKLDNNKVKLEITIEADKFEEGLQKAFFKIGRASCRERV